VMMMAITPSLKASRRFRLIAGTLPARGGPGDLPDSADDAQAFRIDRPSAVRLRSDTLAAKCRCLRAISGIAAA
jgi:hypothetical protein